MNERSKFFFVGGVTILLIGFLAFVWDPVSLQSVAAEENRMDFSQTNGVRYAKVWIPREQHDDWLSKASSARQRLAARAGGQWLAIGGYWDDQSKVVLVFKAKPKPLGGGN